MDKAIDIINDVLRAADHARERFGGACAMVADRGDGRGTLPCIGGPVHGGDHVYKCEDKGQTSYKPLCPQIAPGDRATATARIGFLLPALTDDALHAVLLVCEAAPKRALDAGTLAEEQKAREGTAPAELTDAQVLDVCAQGGAITEEQRARLEADGRPLAVSRAMANALHEAGAASGLMSNLEPDEDERAFMMAQIAASLPASQVRANRGTMLSRLWLEANKCGAREIRVLLRMAIASPKDPEIVGAVASSPETINGRAQADREALERAGDVLARVHEHDRADALRAGLRAAGKVLAEGWKRGEHGEALMSRAQEARDAAVLGEGERLQQKRERVISQTPAHEPGEQAPRPPALVEGAGRAVVMQHEARRRMTGPGRATMPEWLCGADRGDGVLCDRPKQHAEVVDAHRGMVAGKVVTWGGTARDEETHRRGQEEAAKILGGAS